MGASEVRIVEVGPRDGLQNESAHVPTADKARFIALLADAGLTDIEAGSFVHPKAVPQLADAADLAGQLPTRDGLRFAMLVPNLKGLERAASAGVRRIAVFTAASDGFAKHNINMTVAESLGVFGDVIKQALEQGMSVRGYVSTCFVCPYDGEIAKERVLEVCSALLDLGVDEVAVSDTLGVAVPTDIERTVGHLLGQIPADKIALHLHDTCGTALANVCAGLKLGIRTFDAAAGGLGGCPYAPGAAGNLATEDLVYMLDRMGIRTGVDLDKLITAARYITDVVGRAPTSRQLRKHTAEM